MSKHVLEVDSLRKLFGNKLAVSDVYLKCETSKIIGLLGRNGSGKSTLLKIIFGIVSAENKCIRIDGTVKLKTSEILKDVSYLHQEQFIPNYFSVTKAISLSIGVLEMKQFLEDNFIQSILNKKIRQLSSGELRYLEIKLVLYNSSKFVLLDEPFNGLSPLMVEKVIQLIKENSFKKGIIITDHDYENVMTIATQLLLMKDGKIHAIKDKTDLIEKQYLSPSMI
ncbi:ATP-binding cassette domain-containing protein [Flavobacterium sp. 5]|uniref:ATP-binding cassette domain-containing protein n=1 Tax=Flavobacterium sp. 5 TaxID=2035199 RepID=UPI000C2B65DF|nr:ATP-binding cassette domain-containing protein [Flavobacterium sp. 5]PKB16925.1 ABC-type cobalamin/Fe3+-siderophores transport system ATPase subunit [Flavobacterium sp. 5]